jgi:hypothetical protein
MKFENFPFQFLQDYFWILFALALAWVALGVVASAIYRTMKSKPLYIAEPANPLFVERWTSGRSLRNLAGRFGGAKNCLFVAVTRSDLIVRPHFPFTLMFLPELFGLEMVVPRSNVRGVEHKTGLFGDTVILDIQPVNGTTYQVELRLRNVDGFTKAMSEKTGLV